MAKVRQAHLFDVWEGKIVDVDGACPNQVEKDLLFNDGIGGGGWMIYGCVVGCVVAWWWSFLCGGTLAGTDLLEYLLEKNDNPPAA